MQLVLDWVKEQQKIRIDIWALIVESKLLLNQLCLCIYVLFAPNHLFKDCPPSNV